jgi:hypothetical protein
MNATVDARTPTEQGGESEMGIYRSTGPRIGSLARVVAQVPRAWSDRQFAVVDEAMPREAAEEFRRRRARVRAR